MKWRRGDPVSEAEWAAEGVVGEEEMPPAPGWVATMATGAVSLTVTAVRWLAWGLLLAGPVLGLMALVSQPGAAVVQQPARAERGGHDQAVGPSGLAELYVQTYLSAGPSEELAAFYPEARQLPELDQRDAVKTESVATVRVRRVSAGYWSVTVAARVPGVTREKGRGPQDGKRSARLRYFQVPVHTGSGGGLMAMTLPAEVSAPREEREPQTPYGTAQDAVGSDGLVQTLDAVFGAYLGGGGELDRYLSPGTSLRAVAPAPYRAVKVTGVAEVGTNSPLSAEEGRPRDGQRRRLLVDVEATDAKEASWPLTYALQLRARDGRWEVASLEAAPATGPGA